MPKYSRNTPYQMVVRHAVARGREDGEDRSSARPPRCLWREMWYRHVGMDVLVINASIYRSDNGLVGEHYTFFNGERLRQLDTRIVDHSDKAALQAILEARTQVIFERCGLAEKEAI